MLICTDKGDYVVAEKVVAVSVQKGFKEALDIFRERKNRRAIA